MIDIRLAADRIDYEKAIKLLLPLIFSSRIACKAAEHKLLCKLKGKTQEERDVMLVEFINEHRSNVIKTVNVRLTETGDIARLYDVSAEIKK